MQNLILSQIEALQLSMTPLEEQALLSFQQENQIQIMATFTKYFHNLKEAYLKDSLSKIHQKLLYQYSLLGNSLWSQASSILQYIQEMRKKQQKQNNYVLISHLNYHSQSPLLGIYAKLMGHRVKIVGSKRQIERGWSNSTVKIQQLDKKSAFKDLMVHQGIDVIYFQNEDEDQIENISQKDKKYLDIQIIDIFNTHATLFKPYLLNKIINNKQQKNKDILNVIYVHPTQVQQITNFINQVTQNRATINQLDVNICHPNESSSIWTNKLQEQLMSFLSQQANHPNKQDIIIFHPVQHQFIKRIKNVLKKNSGDLLKNIKIIHAPNQNQTACLPPPPSFISKVTNPASTSYSQKQSPKRSQKSQPGSKIMQSSQVKHTTSTISNESLPGTQLNSKNRHIHNIIYILPNFKTLIQWGYDLSHVFYVFDFRHDQQFYYDYDLITYVQADQSYVTQKQALLRMSCMGMHKIGKYVYVKEKQQDQAENIRQEVHKYMVDDSKCKDIGGYVLSMIDKGYQYFWKEAEQCKQVKNCIKALIQTKIIQKQGGEGLPKYSIVQKQVLNAVKKIRDLNPILCTAILAAKHGQDQQNISPSRLALQLALATGVMMMPGSLRLVSSQNNSVTNRPTQIWRQSGYLHSAIDVLVRAKIIEYRQNQISQGKKSKKSVSKRLSKQTSQQFDVFGNLFEIVIADRLTFDKMTVEDLLRQQFVNQKIFHKIVDKIQKICEVLDLQDSQFSSFQDINSVLVDLMQHTNKSVGFYSGSRRVGYFVKGQPDGIFPSKSSLLTTLNQRPLFIYISRISSTKYINGTQKLQILMCNSIPEVTLIQTLGSLPSRKTKSYGETQIQYHGITSATFKYLWRNNGTEIQTFQEKNSCLVEPNQEIAIISIHCPKQKQKSVKAQFDAVLTKVKEKMSSQTKITHYLGSTSLLLGSGGKVLQVIKDKYINKCVLSNLDLSVEVEHLQQLFEQFFNLKSIQVRREPPSASFKSAYIQFQTQKDYYRFYEYYNQCRYLNRFLKVNPIQSIPAASTLKQEMYLQFIWTAWKSGQQAIAQFQEQEAAVKCLQSLKQQQLDGKLIKSQLKNGNKIYMQGLNVLTDQVNLQKALQNYGKIKSIQILKTICKQNLKSQQAYLQQQIRKKFPNVAVDITIKNVQKLKNGLRKCKVIYKDENKLNQTIAKLNEQTGIMGVGRVHVQSWFVYPIKVPHGYLSLYEKLVDAVLRKIPNNRIKIQNSIYGDQQYIVAKSHLKQQIDVFKQNINADLRGYGVDLTGLEISILLSQVGMQNLVDLQQKHNCRLIPDFGKKTLTVIALFQNVKTIKQQIKAKVQDNFFYRIPLNHKSFKHFKQNPQNIQNMKKQYHLTDLQLEQVGRNLLLEGSANNVEKAFNYLMHIIESVSKPTEQQMLNADVCGICCQDPSRPYRLQQCGHKFCLNCLLESVNTALGDMSMFPVKCPQCLSQISIIDLNQLMTAQTWPKLNNMALNQYVGRNSQIVSNCFTAGCKQVNFMITNYFNCDQCNQSYCIECKLNNHPGMTCQQAKQGGNAAFEKYMKQNGIRKCPNQSCKMPIMRLDGCYRVTCSRCNKSMCFKCQPDKMIAYQNYNDCYKHLTDVHGGYW